MTKFNSIFAAVAVAGAALAAPAYAAPIFSTIGFTPGVAPTSAGFAVVQDFNTNTTGLSGTYTIHAGSPNDDNGASPSGGTSPYLSVLGSSNATYTFANPTSSIQFDWGTASIDNVLTIYTTAGNFQYTVPNSDIPNGANYNANGKFFATLTNGTITGLNFAASRNSFEVDNIAVAVPEPATWGMMIVGFGLMGGVLRRRSTKVAFA